MMTDGSKRAFCFLKETFCSEKCLGMKLTSMMDYYTLIRKTWKMASVKHHDSFNALMRQLSEFTCVKRAINIGKVQRYCGRLEQVGCLLRGWGVFMLFLTFLYITVKSWQCPESQIQTHACNN